MHFHVYTHICRKNRQVWKVHFGDVQSQDNSNQTKEPGDMALNVDVGDNPADHLNT